MGWKEFMLAIVRREKRLSGSERHAEDLRHELRASRVREAELLKLVAEKDAQIRLVLEERFYRPAVTPALLTKSAEPPDPNFLNDVAAFDPEADAATIEEQDRILDRLAAQVAKS